MSGATGIRLILDAVQELNQAHLESDCEDFQRSERWVLAPSLDVADVCPAQPHMLRQVILIPTFRLAQGSDALPQPHTDVFSCHPSSMDVSFWLYFANWLHLH